MTDIKIPDYDLHIPSLLSHPFLVNMRSGLLRILLYIVLSQNNLQVGKKTSDKVFGGLLLAVFLFITLAWLVERWIQRRRDQIHNLRQQN